jgi:hypothetical protein
MTAVPAAIDGILALMHSSAVLGVDGVLICDGPWLVRPIESDVVVIGWLPEEGPTVGWHSDHASLRIGDTTQDFTIQGLVSTWRGDDDLQAARRRADVLLEAVRVAIQNDQTLGGAVNFAALHTISQAHWRMEKGVEVPIQFGIHARVF